MIPTSVLKYALVCFGGFAKEGDTLAIMRVCL